mmetsp:Transcript_8809/g.16453  ORF Transcript_8809/g.16453 Transcript_8809/m.16453 type:complete len:85 (-) Transcript_8809:3129-3383(-)
MAFSAQDNGDAGVKETGGRCRRVQLEQVVIARTRQGRGPWETLLQCRKQSCSRLLCKWLAALKTKVLQESRKPVVVVVECNLNR